LTLDTLIASISLRKIENPIAHLSSCQNPEARTHPSWTYFTARCSLIPKREPHNRVTRNLISPATKRVKGIKMTEGAGGAQAGASAPLADDAKNC